MEPDDEDIQLMLRFKNGDESCFEKLVERHKERVFNLVYRFLGSYLEAQDLAQEVFLKIYHARNSYTPQAKFTTWLYTICKNTCLNTLREKNPVHFSIDNTLDLEEDTVAPQFADTHTPSPSDLILQQEQATVVKNAIDSLPAAQKMVVLLYRYDQFSYEEISKIMNCTPDAVKSLLHRAKLQLKEKLKDYIDN
jgi:RNA polymerase sigma-70 factor (ECF subfamily)